jgi:hypothetical protein
VSGPTLHSSRLFDEVERLEGDTALAALSPEFDNVYSKVGRPSIPLKVLQRALLLRTSTGSAASSC